MPVLTMIFGALRFFLGTKVGRFLLLVLALAVAFGLWTWYVNDRAYDRAMAKVDAATVAESKRRIGSLVTTRKWADAEGRKLASLEAANVSLEREAAVASAVNVGPCWDAVAVERLRAAGRR